MKLRIHVSELERIRSLPLPYWDNDSRSVLAQVSAGEPGIETDENDQPTGWLLISDRRITDRELYILDVLRAAWAYADSEPDGASSEDIMTWHAAVEWQLWQALEENLEAGFITLDEAVGRVWAHVLDLGNQLGVEYVEPSEDESEEPPMPPDDFKL